MKYTLSVILRPETKRIKAEVMSTIENWGEARSGCNVTTYFGDDNFDIRVEAELPDDVDIQDLKDYITGLGAIQVS